VNDLRAAIKSQEAETDAADFVQDLSQCVVPSIIRNSTVNTGLPYTAQTVRHVYIVDSPSLHGKEKPLQTSDHPWAGPYRVPDGAEGWSLFRAFSTVVLFTRREKGTW
jgi:hypothetical protein